MRARWKAMLIGLALAATLSLWLGWRMHHFDYESGLSVLRMSWDGVHWGIERQRKEMSVEPLGQFFVEVGLIAMIFGAPAGLVLGLGGFFAGRSWERSRHAHG